MGSKHTKAKIVQMREQLIIDHMDDERVKTAVYDMIRHYEITDIMRKTNKAAILKAVYLDPKRKSIVAMTMDFYVCDNSISRYRSEFLDYFKASMQLCGAIDEIAAAWDRIE